MKWENGVCTVNEIIHGFGPSQEVTFIGVDGDWVIYEHKFYYQSLKGSWLS